MFTHNFEKDADILIEKILNKESFAFSRYADGEYHVMNALSCRGCDGWVVSSENSLIAKDLTDAFSHNEDNYFYGISCTCCDLPRHTWFKEKLNQSWDKVTYSSVFVNSNFNKFENLVNTLSDSVVLLVNSRGQDTKYPFAVEELLHIPDDVITWYEQDSDSIKESVRSLSLKYTNQLFFISAGPLSEILISLMYKSNPNNTYIDVGSSLDPWTHQRYTRPYQEKGSMYSQRGCVF